MAERLEREDECDRCGCDLKIKYWAMYPWGVVGLCSGHTKEAKIDPACSDVEQIK